MPDHAGVSDLYPAVMCDAAHRPVDDSPVLAAGPPWLCSLLPSHEGRHEVWVLHTFTDGRASQWALAWAWGGEPEQLTFDAA